MRDSNNANLKDLAECNMRNLEDLNMRNSDGFNKIFFAKILILVMLIMILNQFVLGLEQYSEVYFHESNRYFVNPFMGAVAHAENKEREVDGSLVLAAYTWKELEKVKGRYDFEALEAKHHYQYWTDEKKNLYMFGISMDVPKLSKTISYQDLDIPIWLYQELKQEAIQKYRKVLQQKDLSVEQVREAMMKLWKVSNDQKVLETFNRSQEEVADLPEVGTFYRYSIPTPSGLESRVGFSPNYKSPLVISYHDHLIKELAKRYDNEKSYAVIMGSLGHWGEMHTFFIKEEHLSGRYPPQVIAKEYEAAYPKYFKHILVSVRYPREVAKNNNYGLHSHAFGDHQSIYNWHIDFYQKGYTDHSNGEKHPAMKDFWKKSPSGGEFLYSTDARYLKNNAIHESIKQAEDTHLTWFNELWYGLDGESRKNQEYFFSKIGYRFVPKKVKFTSSVGEQRVLKIESLWKNAGTAPFYKDWKIRAVLKDISGKEVFSKAFETSIMELMPGEEKEFHADFDLPKSLKKGSYQLYIGIYNDKTNQPEIKLAVEEKEENGLYLLGKMAIQ